MEEVFVGRQPIYNRALNVVAYELLYRNSRENRASFVDGDLATRDILINSLLEIGLDAIVGHHPAFINLTRGFIVGDMPMPMARERVILEILEDVLPEPAVMEALRGFARDGYLIALDDFDFRAEVMPLLEVAHIVKVEVNGRESEDLKQRVEQLRPHKVQLLAEKVETHEQFALCSELGFDYFQGYFFCKPHVVNGRALPANRLVLLNLLARLQDPAVELEELEELISHDASLSYRLLRYINSAFFGLPKEIDSIRRALMMLGLQAIKTWSSLILLSRVDDKPVELLNTALARAKMCELLSTTEGVADKAQGFTVGLFSLLDAIMDSPLETLLENLPLSGELSAALLRHEGALGTLLKRVKAYERADWELLAHDTICVDTYRNAYLEALAWTADAQRALGEPDAG